MTAKRITRYEIVGEGEWGLMGRFIAVLLVTCCLAAGALTAVSVWLWPCGEGCEVSGGSTGRSSSP